MYTFKKHITVVLLAGLLVFVILVAVSCKKKSESTTATKKADSAAEDMKEATTEVMKDIEQTVCPVMGAPINKNIYTEYKGKKVYFCCPGCKESFEKDPGKYLAKLPQFEK